MPRQSQHPKAETFNFRLDPALKAAFTAAAEAEDRPAAQVLRDFMRAYVDRRRRRNFEAEAHRQSLLLAGAAVDPASDEAQVLRELDTAFDDLMAEDDGQ